MVFDCARPRVCYGRSAASAAGKDCIFTTSRACEPAHSRIDGNVVIVQSQRLAESGRDLFSVGFMPLNPHTITRVRPPLEGLGDVVQSVIWRDTRAAELSPAERLSYGSATPCCHIYWSMGARVEIFEHWNAGRAEGARSAIRSDVMFCGGLTRPWVSYAPGSYVALILVLRPDAIRHLWELDPAEWLDRRAPFDESLVPAHWVEWAQEILALLPSGLALDRVQDRLAEAGHPRGEGARCSTEWRQRLMARLGEPLLQLGFRQFQRVFVFWTGFTANRLMKLERLERCALSVAQDAKPQSLSVKELASREGFSHSSHLTRDCVNVTGFPPGELLRRCLGEESFWPYRAYYGIYTSEA